MDKRQCKSYHSVVVVVSYRVRASLQVQYVPFSLTQISAMICMKGMFSTIIMPIAEGKSDTCVMTSWQMRVLNRNICTPMDRGTSDGKLKSEGKKA